VPPEFAVKFLPISSRNPLANKTAVARGA